MARKATKSLATRNTSRLNTTHIVSITLNIVFFALHFLFNRPSRLLPYFLLNGPALAIEFYLDRLGRPKFSSDSSVRSAGEDLDAKGLTEYMWDVLYWTWICVGTVCLFGDRAWWLYLAVPAYSTWLAWTTASGVRKGFGGMGQEDNEGVGVGNADSKRQKKMEKKGGHKISYR